MKPRPTNRHGIRLRKRFAKIRDNRFVFVTEREVAYTNNASESALRPSVVFRKVTNGFGSVWGADPFAGVRSVIRSPASAPSLTPDDTNTSSRFRPSATPWTDAPLSSPHRFIRVSNYLYLSSDSYFTARAAGPLGRRPARPSRNEWRAWLERHVVDAGEVEEHEVGVKAGEASRSEPTVTLAPRSSMARTGAMPEPRRRLLPGLWVTEAPASACRRSRSNTI